MNNVLYITYVPWWINKILREEKSSIFLFKTYQRAVKWVKAQKTCAINSFFHELMCLFVNNLGWSRTAEKAQSYLSNQTSETLPEYFAKKTFAHP